MLSRLFRGVILAAAGAASAAAQSSVDGMMLPKRVASTGLVYAHESWQQYWEGTLKRSNGNIGTLTTESFAWVGGYGITDRLSVMAMLPYVRTHASQGVLSEMSGMQDLTVSAKYRILTTRSADRGTFSALVAGTAAIPVSNYTPDFFPLSIGTSGGRASGRFILSFQSTTTWFANASAAYTWCSNVRLNRSSYYTDGQLYLTNEVAMPNVLETSLGVGYKRGRWHAPLTLVQQRTLGGGDIRRQDMPFVSNRMDFVKVDGGLMYSLSAPKGLSIRLGAAHVLSGRNVGQSTTFTSGLLYAHRF